MQSELKASIDSYSKAWTLPYVTDMYEHITREVREMIYTQIWDTEYLGTTGSRKMRNHATSSDNFRPEEFLHVIRLEFVGYEVAREVVEAWYQAVARPEEDSRALEVSWIGGGALKRVISQDIFKLCVIPATVLRKLHFTFPLESILLHQTIGRFSKFRNAISRQKAFEPLYKIKRKFGFQLKIALQASTIKLNLWPEIFDLLGPIVKSFEKEGASTIVEIVFGGFEHVVLNVTSLVRSYDPFTWRQDVVKFYDEV
jgi:hypothetical protein